ncbi:MAG: acyloxyacyl hydrolase [Chitinophagaceae bacterium]
MISFFKRAIFSAVLVTTGLPAVAQDTRTQYPPGLKNAYFGVNIGYINYPFSAAQLEPGFSVEAVSVPHTAVRIVLYGCQINKYLSARITYMRPVNWVLYKNINGDKEQHSVWMNIAGLTLQGQLPVGRKFSLSAEAGLGVITRNGFEKNNVPVVKNANYGTGLFGGGIQYHLNKKWDLQVGMAWSPENKTARQPHTLFIGGGFHYHLTPLPAETVERNAKSGYHFPKEFIFAGYTTNALGYGVNTAVSKGPVPVFWGGDTRVKQGFSLSYQRNIFHARKVFAMDWAVHTGLWKSRKLQENIFTVSLNPVLRFNFFRSRSADLFFEYSVAGPTFITRTRVDDIGLGRRFTFHDFMGIGAFAGAGRKLYAGIRIAHYSNGNLFPENDGVMIPLTFNLGYILK